MNPSTIGTGFIHLGSGSIRIGHDSEQEATLLVKEALRRRRTALAAYGRAILGRGLEAEILEAREDVRKAEQELANALLELENQL